jgi:hypothetical protein
MNANTLGRMAGRLLLVAAVFMAASCNDLLDLERGHLREEDAGGVSGSGGASNGGRAGHDGAIDDVGRGGGGASPGDAMPDTPPVPRPDASADASTDGPTLDAPRPDVSTDGPIVDAARPDISPDAGPAVDADAGGIIDSPTGCSPTTCATGCCDTNGRCLTTPSNGACGTGGKQCATRATGQQCDQGFCRCGPSCTAAAARARANASRRPIKRAASREARVRPAQWGRPATRLASVFATPRRAGTAVATPTTSASPTLVRRRTNAERADLHVRRARAGRRVALPALANAPPRRARADAARVRRACCLPVRAPLRAARAATPVARARRGKRA